MAMGSATGPPDDQDDRNDRTLAYVCRRLDYLRDLLNTGQGTSG
jgi:hypothetical protein